MFRYHFRRHHHHHHHHVHIDLTEGSIRRHLFNLSYPMALGILAMMTFSLVDTFFISFLGTNALAAIGFTFPVIMIMIGLFVGLGVGNNVLVSRAFGVNDHRKAARYITDGILLSLLIVSIVSTLGLIFMDELFLSLGVPKNILGLVDSYMFPWFFGLVFMGLPLMTDKSLSAMGDTRTPAKIMMISALINVVLDPLLIFGFWIFPELGIAGASWASVISRIVGTILILRVLYKRELIQFLSENFIFEMLKSWKEMIKISVPMAFNTVMVQVIIMVLNKVMATYGIAVIAGFGIAVKIEAFAAILLLAVGESMPAFIGQNFGARRHDRIDRALNYNAFFAIFWSIICLGLYYLIGEQIISIFTDDVDVINFAFLYLVLTCVSYSGVELMYASHSLFNSIDKSHYSMVFTIFQTVLMIIGIYLGTLTYGIVGGILGLVISRIFVGYFEFLYAKFLLSEDADVGMFYYFKPHFIKKIIER